MLAYIWLEKETAEKALESGLAPEGEGIKGLALPRTGKAGKYIAALIHPKDTYAAAEGADNICLRLEIDTAAAFVIDAGRIGEKTAATLTPAANYVLGSFRRPLLIVSGPVPAQNIRKYEGLFDAPLLYENSEKLYIDRQFALADEADPTFRETALRAYYEKQAGIGRAVKNSGETLPVKELVNGGKKEKKPSAGGLLRLFSGAGRASKQNSAPQPGAVSIVETAEEYTRPDGTLLGVSIEKERR